VGEARIDADRTQIVQLFANLISNAVKYHKPGSAPVVRIGIVRGEGGAVDAIFVADQGIGFESRYANQIFEPFKRLHTRNEFPGTGIGLAICATVARRHGWRLEVESEPDKGSVFRIMPGTDCRIAHAEAAAE
jgi:signal transduction histidine kinase